MRKFGLFLTSAMFICFMSVALVEGQGGDKKKGGGFGGFGGGGQQNPINLFNRADVKKELDITDAQIEKLPPEIMVAISKVLDKDQFKRFKEIDLQQRGNNAFKDKAVQKQLKLTSEQTKNIESLLEDSGKELAELFKGLKGGGAGGFKGIQEKQENIRKETKEKIFTVLTKEQRSTWRDMIGKEFTFQQGGFGGFGGGAKKDDTKKKDNE